MKYMHKCQIKHVIDDPKGTIQLDTFVLHAILCEIPENYFGAKLKVL